METILIVDDEADFRFNLSNILKDEGYETIAVADGKDALKVVKDNSPNLVLLDIKLSTTDGIRVLEQMRKLDKDLIVIMLTAYGDIKGAVKAMKLGAYDYITKPFVSEGLLLLIKRALQTQYLSKEVQSLRKRLGEKVPIEEAMGESPQIKQVIKQVEIIAPTKMTAILQGESGTGKELIAQMIHQKSPRCQNPFVAIDCGAIPETLVESELFGYERGAFTGADDRKEGKFEQANGGTFFLDEIVNLSDATQMKFLRVLEERKLQHLGGKKDIKIDVRIIVATKTNLSEAVRRGRFRDDLFYRLNEFRIDLPALRERKEDIPVLAKYLLEEANQEFNKRIEGFSPEAMKLLFDYHWPGNVRELKNAVRKGVLLADFNIISPEQLRLEGPISQFEKVEFKQDIDEGLSLREKVKETTKQMERDIIRQALAKSGGNKAKAAKILNINRKALYRKMKSSGVAQ